MRTSTKPESIRAAAQTLFLRSGLERTSMDAIAAEAKVSKQTLYRYYGSKDELFIAVLSRLTAERVQAQVDELMPASSLSRDQLEERLLLLSIRLLDALLDPRYLALLRIVIAESEAFPELASQFRASVIARGAGALATLLRSEHVAPLLATADVAPALRLLMGPLLSYVLGALLGDPAEIRALADAELPVVVRLFTSAIAALSPPAAH